MQGLGVHFLVLRHTLLLAWRAYFRTSQVFLCLRAAVWETLLYEITSEVLWCLNGQVLNVFLLLGLLGNYSEIAFFCFFFSIHVHCCVLNAKPIFIWTFYAWMETSVCSNAHKYSLYIKLECLSLPEDACVFVRTHLTPHLFCTG